MREAGLGNEEELEKAKRESHGLGFFVRSLVGLNRAAAKAAFAEFLQGSILNASQIDFLGMVIDHLTEHGAMDPALLYESPYTDISPLGVEGVFNPPQVVLLLGVPERASFYGEGQSGATCCNRSPLSLCPPGGDRV